MNWRALKSWPWPISLATILLALSAVWLGLFSLGAFGQLGMPFFQAVGLPMQLTVIVLGFLLMGRLMRNRPESLIRSVPVPVRLIVPVAVAIGVLQVAFASTLMPKTTPSGAPAHSFNASVEDGVCVAVYNGTERVTETPGYCADYQSHFNSAFAGAWLLFAALELWLAWAIYGSPPVQRVPVDRQPLQRDPSGSGADGGSIRGSQVPYLWLTVRLAILVYWIVSGWRGFGPQPMSIPSFALVFAAAWGAIATRYWIVQAYTSSKRTEPWLLPSWYLNPFQRSQPFQFFELAGQSFLVFGVAHLVREGISGTDVFRNAWPPELFAAAFGVGILVGIRWAVMAYRSRFQRVSAF